MTMPRLWPEDLCSQLSAGRTLSPACPSSSGSRDSNIPRYPGFLTLLGMTGLPHPVPRAQRCSRAPGVRRLDTRSRLSPHEHMAPRKSFPFPPRDYLLLATLVTSQHQLPSSLQIHFLEPKPNPGVCRWILSRLFLTKKRNFSS